MDDAQMRARALARWEGEGGALIQSDAADSLDSAELNILARLGAALLDYRADVPPDAQAKIIDRARTLGRPGDRQHVKAQLAQFLRENRTVC